MRRPPLRVPIGTFATATTLDFTQDALAAVAWLHARPEVARDRVGRFASCPASTTSFQTAKTGAPTEYADIAETMSPTALTMIRDWLLRHARAR